MQKANFFLAHGFVDDGVRDFHIGCFLVFDDLHLLVKFGTLVGLHQRLRLLQQIVVLLVAPLGQVLPAGARAHAAAQEEEIVWIAIVAGPAELRGHVLALLGALAIFTPLVGDQLGLDTDLVEIGLHHLGDALGVGIVGARHGHVPKVDFERQRDTGFLQKCRSFGWIVGIILHRVVVTP